MYPSADTGMPRICRCRMCSASNSDMNLRIAGRILFVLLGSIGGIVAAELLLATFRGSACQELFPTDEYFYDVEIYEPFFSIKHRLNGPCTYRTQRSRATYEEFTVKPQPGVTRVFVFGESTAQGFCETKELLKSQLEQCIPSHQFEVIGCGTGGYDSDRLVLTARDLVRYKPDLMVLFIGNNAWNFRLRHDPILESFWGRFLYTHSRFYRFVHLRQINQIPQPACSDKSGVVRENLERIIGICKERRIPLLVSALPTNFKDCPPLISRPPYEEQEYFEGHFALLRKQYRQALLCFTKLRERRNMQDNPYVLFSLAKTLDFSGSREKARFYYLSALSRDEEGNRVTPARNEEIRSLVANQKEGVLLFDLDRLFSAAAPDGLVGDLFFRDNCHWLQPYNRIIAQEIIRNIALYNTDHTNPLLASNDAWDTASVPTFDSELHAASGIVTQASDYVKRNEWVKSEFVLWGVSNILEHGYSERAVAGLKHYLSLHPEWGTDVEALKVNLLQQCRKSPWARNLVPKVEAAWPDILCHMGVAQMELGMQKSAEMYFDASIRAGSQRVYPYLFRGELYAYRHDFALAQADWEQVIRIAPAYSWLRNVYQHFRIDTDMAS